MAFSNDMRYLGCLFLVLTGSNLLAETPAIYIDGRIVFSTVTVGGVPVWSAEEQAAVENLHGIRGRDAALVFYTPDNFEIAVATSGIKFSGYSDFRNCVGDKQYLADKLDDLPVSTQRRLKSSIDFLRGRNSQR